MTTSLSDMDKKQKGQQKNDRNIENHPPSQLPFNPDASLGTPPTAASNSTYPPPVEQQQHRQQSPLTYQTQGITITHTRPSPFGPSFASSSTSSSSTASSSTTLSKAEEKALRNEAKARAKLEKQEAKDRYKEAKNQANELKRDIKYHGTELQRDIKHHSTEFQRDIKHQTTELKRGLSCQATELKRGLSHQAKQALTAVKNELERLDRGNGIGDPCGSSSCCGSGAQVYATPSVLSAPVQQQHPGMSHGVVTAYPPRQLSPAEQLALQHEQIKQQKHLNRQLYKEQKCLNRHERRERRRLEREIRREERHVHVPFPFGLVTLGPRIVGGVARTLLTDGSHHQQEELRPTVTVAPAPLIYQAGHPPQQQQQQPLYQPPMQVIPPFMQPYSPYYPSSQPSPQPEQKKSEKNIGPQDPLLVYSMSNLSLGATPPSSALSLSSSSSRPAPSAPPMAAIGAHSPELEREAVENDDMSVPPPPYEATASSASRA
ncbi:hypothetical protein BC939DRAFT_442310 [Gamsiella multidivaricata]|uniref:uncharacterized protein n=1 Tax=Gamsiella multidivaricata TaxID=101098 RepID=UPI00222058BA|nr:uncharacterized protein BC939DRAFT_442310 [Gamsiella multidivaricata]KAG0365371.1 hypothetical protein BGZ54_006578 [Gamsiella multidivaricata]KAI7828928.1 hypothetical protein BC939DRAFT_442310 [Gamsiella multidivaricata]